MNIEEYLSAEKSINAKAFELDAQTLNSIIHIGAYAGMSGMLGLLCSPQGRAILLAAQDKLSNILSSQTLNAIVNAGENAGYSVAFKLRYPLIYITDKIASNF